MSSKKSFTLLEMIFVIVVLGIIATITTDIIGSLFRNYNNAKVLNDLTLKTSNALTIIKKRVDRAIEDSVVFVDDSSSPSGYKAVFERGLTDLNISDGALLWIGKDIESFKLSGDMAQNGYSGFADVIASSATDIVSPQSMFESISLNDTNSTQFDITGVPLLSGANHRSVIYFPYYEDSGDAEERFWTDTPSSLHKITTVNGEDDITIEEDKNITIVENYSLSYSAYAITLDGGDLNLHYNFRPWNGDGIDDNNVSTETIIDNVNAFKFWSEANGGLLRLQLCVSSEEYMTSSSDSEEFRYCKESAVILR
ncbi:MAG: prepilin-type N-terminal cleavage/methylation domain-containing protein [Campylobacterales bacterium]